ncbi:hypothetical protein LXL04_021849 [Taraxacum kok-saghyz]
MKEKEVDGLSFRILSFSPSSTITIKSNSKYGRLKNRDTENRAQGREVQNPNRAERRRRTPTIVGGCGGRLSISDRTSAHPQVTEQLAPQSSFFTASQLLRRRHAQTTSCPSPAVCFRHLSTSTELKRTEGMLSNQNSNSMLLFNLRIQKLLKFNTPGLHIVIFVPVLATLSVFFKLMPSYYAIMSFHSVNKVSMNQSSQHEGETETETRDDGSGASSSSDGGSPWFHLRNDATRTYNTPCVCSAIENE